MSDADEGASADTVVEENEESEEEEESESREHDLDALRTTQQEARTVLDHQIQTFNDVDNKAAKTSQLVGVLLGLLFTAGSFLAQADAFDVTPFLNIYTGLGTVALVVSFIFALVTYSTNKIKTGVGPADINRLIDTKYSEKGWLILLLRSEAAWMEENEKSINRNAIFLTVSHIALILAVVLLVVGAGVVRF